MAGRLGYQLKLIKEFPDLAMFLAFTVMVLKRLKQFSALHKKQSPGATGLWPEAAATPHHLIAPIVDTDDQAANPHLGQAAA